LKDKNDVVVVFLVFVLENVANNFKQEISFWKNLFKIFSICFILGFYLAVSLKLYLIDYTNIFSINRQF
jgi:hypothetical protein